jgi:hypothetical protein
MSNERPSDAMDGEPVERPEHGARVTVRLAAIDATKADYSVALATAGGSWQARASVVELDGEVALAPWEAAGAPPEWLVQAARAVLRSAWQRRRAGHVWPRRLARWRPSPEPGA